MENCAMQLQKFSKLIVYVVLREKLHIDASIITFKIALYVRLISRHIIIPYTVHLCTICLYFVSSAIPISYSTTSNENFSTFDYLEINEVNENFSILECNSNVLSDRFAINCFYCLWKEYWKNLFTANLSFQLVYVSNHLLIIVNTILIKLA